MMCFCIAKAGTPSGREIMLKVKNRPDGDTRYAMLSMTLVQKNGSKRERKLSSWAMDVGKDTKKIMFFTYPGDVKGTGFLTWDYDNPNKEDDKWLYLPAMKKREGLVENLLKRTISWEVILPMMIWAHVM